MHKSLTCHNLPSGSSAASLVIPVRALHAGHRPKIFSHLGLLNAADRRLRFGAQTSNEVIYRYVERLDFVNDAVFGNFDSQLNLIGMAHLAYLPKLEGRFRAAEFGVSVLPEQRAKGIGTALFARAAVHSRNTRIETLFIHCLANNKAMMHLAQKTGMRVEYAHGEADAYLTLPPANSATIVEEAANEQWGGFDYALKENLMYASAAWCWFLRKPNIKVN